LIVDHGVTHTLALPSLYGVLLRETGGRGLGSLDTVIVAGEACARDLLDLHGELMSGVRLFNEYGPTEGTVWSTVYECDPADGVRSVSIGRPIPNARVYLLGTAMKPLPPGVPGEMYIGGPGVARGYLRRPELTAERFLSDPFVDGERIYRTGDLARYLGDGRIEFLGRIDNQVKIRGYRIELEEVEDVLSGAPHVDEAIVVAREEPSGDLRLVAYVVGTAERPLPQELQDHVAELLPDYMVPAVFTVVDSLPRMPNGKVDRAALAAMEAPGPSTADDFVAPRNPTE